MPAPRHVRLRLQGIFGATDQTWSISLNYGFPGTGGIEDGVVTQQELATTGLAIRALNANQFWTPVLLDLMSPLTRIQAFRLSLVGPDGKEELVALTTPAAPIPGTGTLRMPTEVALVASLRTDLPGRRRRGRVYLPALAVSVDAAGRVAGDTGQMATEVAALLAQVGQTIRTNTGAVNVFPVVASTVGGFLTEVTSVAVGNVFDVQRRRRNQQREAHGIAPVPQ